MKEKQQQMIDVVTKFVMTKMPDTEPEQVPIKVKNIVSAFHKMGLLNFTLEVEPAKLRVVEGNHDPVSEDKFII